MVRFKGLVERKRTSQPWTINIGYNNGTNNWWLLRVPLEESFKLLRSTSGRGLEMCDPELTALAPEELTQWGDSG